MVASAVSPALIDIVPWTINNPSTVVVCDTVESDGRFVGYHLALQALRANEKVLWLQGGPVTESLVVRSFKKLGWEEKPHNMGDAAHGVLGNDDDESLRIRSLTVELGNHFLDETDELKPTDDVAYSLEQFLNGLYHDVLQWMRANIGGSSWIVVDDVSTLASIVGNDLAYRFLLSLQCRAITSSTGLYMRCGCDSNMDASDLIKPFGAGGLVQQSTSMTTSFFENSLSELADHIVDVFPLVAGPTRDVHGRLAFTSQVNDSGPLSNMYNYSLQDGKVVAVRVRRL
ncbi:hypothetical protein MPSEU_000901800 [Mayamaea pseudoterrestris]|nr:hypothetical protein MPSEU_000901800 [Mayamaea pseudoterrestris]